MKIFKKVMIFAMLIGLNINVALGQNAGGGVEALVEDSLQDLTLVAFSGVGGAVLGLSTLSFVDEPGDHLDNIIVGGAIGIIVGVGIVAYKQAVESTEQYNTVGDEGGGEQASTFNTSERRRWAFDSHKQYLPKTLSHVGWTFSF